ncbi:MAG: shikimate kinase [Bryobacteraceae bacterium]
MIAKLKRTPGIYLVGFMASGKTTVGRRLADSLGWSFVDTDEDIEAQQGATISDIFDQRGEQEFRRLEIQAILSRISMVERGKPTVVVLGGGAFVQQPHFELLENNGVTVWLDCPLGTILRRVSQSSHRPLARDPEKLKTLYELRRAAYARADFRIDITGDDPGPAVESILRLPIF